MKSFTDISQSKILAEFLPKLSADMAYLKYASSDNLTFRFEGALPMVLGDIPIDKIDYETLPCWSLAALLEVLKEHDEYLFDICFGGYEGEKYVREWFCTYEQDVSPFNDILCYSENAVDACVAMIEKLHELKLL